MSLEQDRHWNVIHNPSPVSINEEQSEYQKLQFGIRVDNICAFALTVVYGIHMLFLKMLVSYCRLCPLWSQQITK